MSLSPVVAGLAMLPYGIPMFVVPRIAARWNTASRGVLSLGLSTSALGDVATAVLATTHASYPAFALGLVVHARGNAASGRTGRMTEPASEEGRRR